MSTPSEQRFQFTGSTGVPLAARLERPAGRPRATALFAHCFTCSKDLRAVRTITDHLTARGFAVMRFDFTGLGESGGDFADTNFGTNLDDLVIAAEALRAEIAAPSLLIGHSLGGAATVVAAARIPSVQAVATIGAPSDTAHVADRFAEQIGTINESGQAEVSLAGRPFVIQKHFVDALDQHTVTEAAAALKAALLVLHSPIDNEVSIEHASRLFTAAKHPKSFVTLDTADHLLTRRDDAAYAANVIASWAERYLPPAPSEPDAEADHGPSVLVAETGAGPFQVSIDNGRHRLLGDEPPALGGKDTGPTPYEFLAAALGACTTITMRMYAKRKGYSVERLACRVIHEKKPNDTPDGPPVDVFTRLIRIDGNVTPDERARIITIANKCPVHRTLEREAHILTEEDKA